MSNHPSFLLLSLLLLSFTVSPAQQKGRIYGTVRDQKTSRPVENVCIYLQPVSYGVETGSDGSFELSGIPAGTYRLVISRIGYHNLSAQSISINAGEELELNFVLQPAVLSAGDGVVITATRSPASGNTIPASVDILDRMKFEHQNPDNLAEVLNNLPGLQIKDYGGLSGIKSISMRGCSAEQVLILLDGQRLNSAQTGQVDFGTISPGGIERVEIVHGGNSAMYGADAVGGVINLITRQDYVKPGLSGSFSTMIGSFNSKSLQGALQFKHENFSTDITYRDLHSSGDFDYTDLNGRKQKRSNNDLISRDFFSRCNLDFGQSASRQKLNFSYRFYYAERGSPGPLSWPSRTSRLYDRTDQINAQYSRKIFNSLTDLQIQAYGHFNWNRYSSYDFSIHDENSSHNDSYGLEAQIRTIRSAAHQIIAGLGSRSDQLNGSDFPAYHLRNLYYLFIQDEIEYKFDTRPASPAMLLIPAVRFDSFSDFGTHFSPKISALVSLGTALDMALKGNGGLVYRAPTFNELYYPEDDWSKGNPDLKPESGYDWDIGLRMRPAIPMQPALDITFFQIRMHDLINWQLEDQKYIPKNVDRTLSNGLELNAVLNPLKDAIALNYNYTLLSAVDCRTQKTLSYRPHQTHNLSLIFSWSAFKLELQGQSVGRRYADAGNTVKLDPYTLYNLILSMHQKFGPVEPRLSLQIINLQDRQYQIIQDYPLPGREIRINFGVSF